MTPTDAREPDVIAELWAALGHDGYRRTDTVCVSAVVLRNAHAEIEKLRKRVESAEQLLRKNSDRINRLSSANGALMVDRDRGVREACEKYDAALVLAQEAAAKSGDGITERDVAARRACTLHVQALIDADREALDVMRMGVLGALLAVEDRRADPRYAGREPELLRALIKTIEGHNGRYTKAPMPKLAGPAMAAPEAPFSKPATPALGQPDLFGEANR